MNEIERRILVERGHLKSMRYDAQRELDVVLQRLDEHCREIQRCQNEYDGALQDVVRDLGDLEGAEQHIKNNAPTVAAQHPDQTLPALIGPTVVGLPTTQQLVVFVASVQARRRRLNVARLLTWLREIKRTTKENEREAFKQAMCAVCSELDGLEEGEP